MAFEDTRLTPEQTELIKLVKLDRDIAYEGLNEFKRKYHSLECENMELKERIKKLETRSKEPETRNKEECFARGHDWLACGTFDNGRSQYGVYRCARCGENYDWQYDYY